MTPTDPQGAGTRVETKVEWRNVYEDGVRSVSGYDTRQQADDAANMTQMIDRVKRIAIERITYCIVDITRYPIPPHAGEETKG